MTRLYPLRRSKGIYHIMAGEERTHPDEHW